MKAALLYFAFVGLVLIGRAEDRVLLARFEREGIAAERSAGPVLPKRAIAFYRSAPAVAPLAEYVEVETMLGSQVVARRISNPAAGQLIDAFESASLPEIDYQKHFDELAKAPPEARRGIAWLPDGGGAVRVRIELHASARTAVFEIWSPEVCFYSHPSDRLAQSVYRLVQACGYAVGSGMVFLSSAELPNQAAQSTPPAVTPLAGQEARQP
jgi:hypothetical protein